MLTRRQFNLRTLYLTVATSLRRSFKLERTFTAIEQRPEKGFPEGDYTPFGYLNNPYHCWAINRSGVLRSVRGIGFGWHYPAGPGGYFDEKKNGVYSAFLRLGFIVAGRRLWDPEDFHEGELKCHYHSNNLMEYLISISGAKVSCAFFQVRENALAVRLRKVDSSTASIQIMVAHQYRLGNSSWWGGDGAVGYYRNAADCLVSRSFAAGTSFAVGSTTRSKLQWFDSKIEPIAVWSETHSLPRQSVAYGQDPLQGAITYDLAPSQTLEVMMARGANESAVIKELRSARQNSSAELADKRSSDASFWRGAPRLEGDWPQHWKNGWVYDFETLRMMVRRPIGVYKHRWDAMQIQAPRNVLAETSMDTWALSYADPELAKEVFLGQFIDAVEPNIPCMREDGVMNMVAADGSECGTSISWCYPFFCASSIYARSRDLRWLGQLYPRLAKLLRWTLANRSDQKGFVVGKCSWETGMDGARRFLIEQPTGAELIDFIRVVELQAATAQAANVLHAFAQELGNERSAAEWEGVHQTYTDKTQQLWNENDWFQDFDTRSGTPITSVGKDIGQVAPIFCEIASADQTRDMTPSLRAFYEQSVAGSAKNPDGWVDGLQWSSLTFPFLESLWIAEEYELLAKVVYLIAERIYPTMDRRNVEKLPGSWIVPRQGESRIGIPGISCEMWTPHGAGGGEGYGWGAVLPVHIMRNLMGIRESDQPNILWLCPNLPEEMMIPGKGYELQNWRYRDFAMDLEYHVLNNGEVDIFLRRSPGSNRMTAKDPEGKTIFSRSALSFILAFTAKNRQRYQVML